MKLFGRAEVDLMVSLGQYNHVSSFSFVSILVQSKLFTSWIFQ